MSNSNNNSNSSTNIFLSLLTVLFIGLKLTGFINWSWWWVLSPIWLPAVVIIGGMIAWYYISNWIDDYKYNIRKKKEKELDEKMR